MFKKVNASDVAPMPTTALGNSDIRDQLVGTKPEHREPEASAEVTHVVALLFLGSSEEASVYKGGATCLPRSVYKLRFFYLSTCPVTGATSCTAFLRLAFAKHRYNKRPVLSEL